MSTRVGDSNTNKLGLRERERERQRDRDTERERERERERVKKCLLLRVAPCFIQRTLVTTTAFVPKDVAIK